MQQAFLQSGAILSSGPDQVLLGYGPRTWTSKPLETNIPSFYFPDFFLTSQTPWFAHDSNAELTCSELLQWLHISSPATSNISWENPYKNLFAETFHGLQKDFSTGKLQKAVPFVFETTQQRMTSEILSNALFHILNYAKERQVYLYGFWDEDQGMLGATPEMLFSHDSSQNIVHTMACAGTARNAEQLRSILEDPKERHEHQLVVDGISASLSHLGAVVAAQPQLLHLPGLSHLVTSIDVALKQSCDYVSLVNALHPTPALGAFPRVEGRVWLENYQQRIDRQRFGAPVGYTKAGNKVSQCYVAIRNIQWDRNGIRIGAGCGVVPASKLENEWQEIQAKIKAIKHMMGL